MALFKFQGFLTELQLFFDLGVANPFTSVFIFVMYAPHCQVAPVWCLYPGISAQSRLTAGGDVTSTVAVAEYPSRRLGIRTATHSRESDGQASGRSFQSVAMLVTLTIKPMVKTSTILLGVYRAKSSQYS
eukprot:3941322-Rhodomonas_salina.1